MIHLGYETGTGKPVEIPLAHMAVTGLTQKSGKTVTMESLVDRGDLRAVVFVTKPGEKSFTKGRRILPFFRERADWEYVKELLEARRNESLSKWDGYLMRVCHGARTLQRVRENVQSELPKKKSARPSHYEVLAGYLDLIIPELERVSYSDALKIEHGVNIMDLVGLSDDMQSMVIRSTIEHILEREHNSVLVMPEAWKFIPEGGRSAVFDALHSLIRLGATNGNFVWIDAQDLAIVEKRILKSVSVWILGKQQEANEVARTINHMIEPVQIRPDMIRSLGVGQFLVCADSQPARKVYVQPWWLGELDALAIARGEESVETAQAIFRQKVREAKRAGLAAPEAGKQGGRENATEQKTDSAKREAVPHESAAGSIHVQRSDDDPGVAVGGKNKTGSDVFPSGSVSVSGGDRGRAADDGQDGTTTNNQNDAAQSEIEIQNKSGADGADPSDGDDLMWQEKYETLKAEHKTLVEAHDALATEVVRLRNVITAKGDTSQKAQQVIYDTANDALAKHPAGNGSLSSTQEEIYRYVVKRAQEDPRVLQILAARPELRVTVERPVLEVDGKTLRGALALLIHKAFFSTPKNGNTTFNELQRLGRKTAKPNVYRELDNLAELGFLTKEAGGGYQSTDLKVTVAK